MKSILFSVILFANVFMLNAQTKDIFIQITFHSGHFQGTHTFTPEKGNYLSQINLEYFEGYSNLNASKLVSENGLQIHYINRTFLGEATKGEHHAKMFTDGCGHLNFIDINNTQSFKKADSDFTGCQKTSITSVSEWKKSIVKKRRVVTGTFSDTVIFEFTMDDGTKTTETVEVSVTFKANESRR